MKCKQRLVVLPVIGALCIIISSFVIYREFFIENAKLHKKDELSVGESERLRKTMDIYPGKLRQKVPGGLQGAVLQRELQGKSRSTDQEEEKQLQSFLGDHKWIADMEKHKLQLLDTLLSKLHHNEEALNKLLEAGYLIANNTLNNSDYILNDDADLDKLKHFLENNGLLLKKPKVNNPNEVPNIAESSRKQAAHVPLTAYELHLLTHLRPRDVKLGITLDRRGKSFEPRHLRLDRENFESDWDGAQLSKHWKDFYRKITDRELFPDTTLDKTIDDMLYHLANEEIIGVENMDGGTQVKLVFYFKDGGKAVFKPMRVTKKKKVPTATLR